MEDNKITFNIENGKVLVTHEQPMPITDFFQVLFTGILSAMNAVVSHATEEELPIVKEDLYDMLNAAASNTLALFAPEIEMRPHLTTQAILEAENALIERAVQQKNAAKQKNKVMPLHKKE